MKYLIWLALFLTTIGVSAEEKEGAPKWVSRMSSVNVEGSYIRGSVIYIYCDKTRVPGHPSFSDLSFRAHEVVVTESVYVFFDTNLEAVISVPVNSCSVMVQS